MAFILEFDGIVRRDMGDLEDPTKAIEVLKGVRFGTLLVVLIVGDTQVGYLRWELLRA